MFGHKTLKKRVEELEFAYDRLEGMLEDLDAATPHWDDLPWSVTRLLEGETEDVELEPWRAWCFEYLAEHNERRREMTHGKVERRESSPTS